MTAPLDAPAAWRHLLDLPPGSPGRAGPISVDRDGTWSSELTITRDAAAMLDVFAPLRIRDTLVIGQLGQSLDGRIATASGHSHYINGPEDIRRLHRLRALTQAVVVGAGTVASDDPRLTVRHVEGPDPIRVVLDPRGRLHPERRVFTDGAAATLWVREGDAPRPGRGSTRDAGMSGHRGIEVLPLPTVGGRFSPEAIVEALRARGLRRILVEGGGLTVSGFLSDGMLDRLHVSVAPLLIGSGRPSLTLPRIETLDEALRPPVRHFRLGSDLLFDLDLAAREG